MPYGAASRAVSGAGLTSLRVSPTGKALARLKALHTLRVTIVVTFQPTGGTVSAATEHATLTLRPRGRLRHAQLSSALRLDIPAVDGGLPSADTWICWGTRSSPSVATA